MLTRCLTVALLAGMTGVATADDDFKVQGYTYVAPSYYLAPPVYHAPFAPPPFAAPVQVYGPAYPPGVVYGPAPVVRYRDRVSVRPREIEYTVRTHGPHGHRGRYKVEVERDEIEINARRR